MEALVQTLSALLPREVRIVDFPGTARAGTGGALFHARDRLAERFLLCNGDSLFDCNLARLLATGDDGTMRQTLLLRRMDDASRYGVVVLDGDRVSAFSARSAIGRGWPDQHRHLSVRSSAAR